MLLYVKDVFESHMVNSQKYSSQKDMYIKCDCHPSIAAITSSAKSYVESSQNAKRWHVPPAPDHDTFETKSLWFVNNFELPNFELKSFFFKYLNYKILSAGGSHPTATSSRELTAHGVTALPSSVALSVLAFFFVLGFGFKLVSKAFAEACKGRGAKLGEPRL